MTKTLTLIKRTVPACPGCTMQEKALESAGIPYKAIDITHEPEAVEKYKVTSIPISIIEDENGKGVVRFNGFRPAELIAEMLK